MIGLFIHPADLSSEEKFNHLCYYKVGDQSILEMTMQNMLRVAYAHKVFVLLPQEQQRNITGVKYGSPPIINAYWQGLKRLASFEYYSDGYWLDAIHHCALQNGIDDIVRVSALGPFLPTWLVNDVIHQYLENNLNRPCTTKGIYPEGFRVDIFPFWHLSNVFIYSEKRKNMEDIEEVMDVLPIKSEKNLMFSSIDQAQEFENIRKMMDLGVDILDLLEDENGTSQ